MSKHKTRMPAAKPRTPVSPTTQATTITQNAPESDTDNLDLTFIETFDGSGAPKKVPKVNAGNILTLQRTYGNRVVQGLLKSQVQRNPPTAQNLADATTKKNAIKAHFDTTSTEVGKLSDDATFNTAIRDKQVNDAVSGVVLPWVNLAAENIISASVKRDLEEDALSQMKLEAEADEIGDGAQAQIGALQPTPGTKTPNKEAYTHLVSKARATELGTTKGKKGLKKQLEGDVAEKAAKTAIADNIAPQITAIVDATKPAIAKMVDKKVGDFRKKNKKEAVAELHNLQNQKNVASHEAFAFGKLKDDDAIEQALTQMENSVTIARNKAEYIQSLVKAVDAVAKSAAGAEARDQRRPAASKVEALLKKNADLRRKIKAEAKDKAASLLTNKTTGSQDVAELKGIKDKVISKEVEGNISSKFDWIGTLIDVEVPREGSRGILEVTVRVPVQPGVFVQVRVMGDVKREDGKIKMNAEATFGAGAGFGMSGFKGDAVGELGGRLEIETDKGGTGAMRLLSYGLYRQGRESSIIPDKLIDYLWGMDGDSGKSPYEEAEAWSKMMEEGMGGSDFVDLGVLAVAQASGDAGVAKARMKAIFFTGKRYNKEYIEFKRKYKKGGESEPKSYNKLVGGKGAQKSVGKHIMLFDIYGRADVGVPPFIGLGGDVRGKLYFEPFKLRTKESRFTKKEIEMSALLKAPVSVGSAEDLIKSLIVWLPAAMKFAIDTGLTAERTVEGEQSAHSETNKAQAVGQGLANTQQAAAFAAWEAVNLTSGAAQSGLASVLSNVLGASTTLKLILKITDSRDKPLEVNVYVDLIQGMTIPIGTAEAGAKVRFDKSERLLNLKFAPAFEVIGLR